MPGALLVLAVAAASTANVADLTACSTTMDGITLVEGDLVLLKNQTTGAENGVYRVGKVASSEAPLTRVEKPDNVMSNGGGLRVSVRKGSVSANLEYQLTTTGSIVIGTTSLTFAAVSQISSAPTIEDFSNADHDHSDAANGGDIDATVALTGAVPVVNGGTGLATVDAGGVLIASADDTIDDLAKGTAYQLLRMNAGATLPEWGAAMGGPVAALPAHAANDVIPPAIVSGGIYTIPALDAGSTITLPADALSGTYCWIIGDGTLNDQAVTVRDATGPTNLTTALTASKRLCVFCLKVGTAWYANAYVSP